MLAAYRNRNFADAIAMAKEAARAPVAVRGLYSYLRRFARLAESAHDPGLASSDRSRRKK
jgi:hypothetical protein